MLGSKQVSFGAEQFAAGMAASDYAFDGGLGTSSTGINPFAKPGRMCMTGAGTDTSTNVSGSVIASCEDGQTVAAQNRVWVTNTAHFQSYNGSSVTDRHTGSKTYVAGTTDAVSFAGYSWITSTTDMARWNTSGFTLNEDYWTNAGLGNQSAMSSSNRHPLIVFEQLLWVPDGSTLKNMNTSLTIATSNWTLPSNELITALGIDPGTGLMMVAVATAQNYSDTLPTRNFVYLYDGYSTKPRRKIPVDDMVTAFYNNGGVVYVGYGQRVGFWNGNGITFLRKLANVTLSGDELPYKGHFSNIGNILLVVDGKIVLAYGEAIPGTKKTWFPLIQNPASTAKLQHVCNVGGTTVGIFFATSKFYTFDIMTPTLDANALIYFPYINFPRPVYIRNIRVITDGVTTTSASGVGQVRFIDETLTTRAPIPQTYVVPASLSPKFVFDFPLDYKVMACQPFLGWDTQVFNIVRVIVYYDPAE